MVTMTISRSNANIETGLGPRQELDEACSFLLRFLLSMDSTNTYQFQAILEYLFLQLLYDLATTATSVCSLAPRPDVYDFHYMK